MEKDPIQEESCEFILNEREMSENDIGWALSKTYNKEHVLDNCQYMRE